MILVILFLFVIALILFLSQNYFANDRKKYNVPGPDTLPVFGNGLMLVGDSASFLKTLVNLGDNYGDIARMYILHDRYFVLSHPKYVEPLISSIEYITKGKSYYYLLPFLGQGLLTASGIRWQTHRKFLTPAFHFNILQSFLPIFLKNEFILINKLKDLADGRDVDILPVVALNALDNISESAMGLSINAQSDIESKYVKTINKVSELISKRMRHPIYKVDSLFSLTSDSKVMNEGLKYLHSFTRNVIETRRKLLQDANINMSNYISEYGVKKKCAFLDLLLLSDIDGVKMNKEIVREEVDTFLFEGYDTTSSAMAFTLYCVSNHEEAQERIYEEQKTILGDLTNEPSYSDLQRMKYLEQVIKESLRLYPSVPLIERKIVNETRIGDIHIPKDTNIIFNIFRQQRHPGIYDNPTEFRPERFEKAQKNPYDFIAFSAGPRNCIGQKFALMELKVTISGIIKNYKVLPSNIEPILGADLILRPHNGVFIQLVPRSPS